MVLLACAFYTYCKTVQTDFVWPFTFKPEKLRSWGHLCLFPAIFTEAYGKCSSLKLVAQHIDR